MIKSLPRSSGFSKLGQWRRVRIEKRHTIFRISLSLSVRSFLSPFFLLDGNNKVIFYFTQQKINKKEV
tara:strand:- start:736 stop:939 length:204 start_codon:yes stop_codon:yes gene_type:complete